MTKIYCVNLDRSPHRWQFMLEQFDRLGLEFERISAVDGRTINQENLAKFADVSRVNDWPDLMTPNAIACSLSHVKAYRRFLEEGAPFAIFMEDDIVLSDDFGAVAKATAKVLPARSCALLYFHGDEKAFVREDAIKVSPGHILYKALTPWSAYTTGAYVLDRAGAEALIRFNDPVYSTADSWGVFIREGALTGLRAVLPPVTSAESFASDIGYSLVGRIRRFAEIHGPAFLSKALRKSRMGSFATRYTITDDQPVSMPPPERDMKSC